MEELKKKEEIKQLEKEINDLNIIVKKKNKKKIIIFSVIFIFLFLIFKVVIGTIDIPVYHYNNGYDITINGELMPYGFYEIYEFPIIPLIVHIRGDNGETGYDIDQGVFIEKQNEYILKIDQYICYTKRENVLIRCSAWLDENARFNKKYFNFNEYKMTIIKSEGMNKNEKIIYSGNFTDNITEYIEPEYYYLINIEGKKNSVERYVNIYFKINEEEN